VAALKSGDFIVVACGRRYFSNDELLKFLETISPVAEIKIDGISSAKIYRVDDENGARINGFGKD
jgi:hypothetical protein